MRNKTVEIERQHIYVRWSKSLELGIPVIDQQHRQFVDLCNELYEQAMSEEDEEGRMRVISQVASKTMRYVKTHFAYEERLMAAVGYVDFEQHKLEHRKFIVELARILGSIGNFSFKDLLNYASFLRNWLLSHIACEDKKYVPAVKAYLKKYEKKISVQA